MKNYLYILLFLLLTAGCASEIEKTSPRTIADFYIGDLNNINRVLIIDQISGDRLNVTDKESIEGFLYAIKDVQFSPDKSENQGKGLYKVAFFENDELTFTFETLPLSLGIMDGDYYYSEPDIFLLVDNYFKDESVQIESENILIYEDIEKRSREYDWWYSLRSELPLENKEKWTKEIRTESKTIVVISGGYKGCICHDLKITKISESESLLIIDVKLVPLNQGDDAMYTPISVVEINEANFNKKIKVNWNNN